MEKKKDKKRKIQFTDDVSSKPHSIDCQQMSEKECMIDLGLLNASDTYEVHFEMPHNLGKKILVPALQSPLIEIKQLEQLGRYNKYD